MLEEVKPVLSKLIADLLRAYFLTLYQALQPLSRREWDAFPVLRIHCQLIGPVPVKMRLFSLSLVMPLVFF